MGGRRRNRALRTGLVAATALAALAPAVVAAQQAPGSPGSFLPPDGLAPADRAAVLAVDSAYVAGWLAGDRRAVLRLFAPDGVLLPDGSPAVRGPEAMEAFWWPEEGPAVTIERYESSVDEVFGSGRLAVVRGTADLTFSWEDVDGVLQRRSSRSRHLTVMARGDDGRWRIVRRMWDGLPPP